MPDGERKRALEVATRALARRGLTAAELVMRLSQKGFDRAVVEWAVTRLREQGAIDEAALVDSVVREASRRHRGSRRVAWILGRRGVTPALAERAVQASEALDPQGARDLVAARFPGGELERHTRARAFRLLLARGYPEELARKTLGIDLDE